MFNNEKYIKIKQWMKQQFSKNLIYPSISEIKKKLIILKIILSNYEIKKFRNSFEGISKYNKLGIRTRQKYGYIANNVSNLGWIQSDLGFMQWRKKKYGKFILAVDELSQMVYVESISNKKYETLKFFFIKLNKIPGFIYLKRVFTDQEAALLSRKNRNDLEKNLTNVKFYVTKRKANQAERYIRTFKLYISKYLLSKQLPYTKWREGISDVLIKMNTKQIKNTNMRPIDINRKTLEKYLNKLFKVKPSIKINFYGNPLPIQRKIITKLFKYDIGDKVYLTKAKYPEKNIQNKYWGETRSIAGHFDKTLSFYKIKDRYLTTTNNLYIIPLYDIISDETNVIIKKIYQNDIRLYPS